MKFWKGNRIDAEFDMPVSEVADQFLVWFDAQPGATDLRKDHPLLETGLERLLRWWLTAAEHFNSVWEAESIHQFGDESFYGLYDLIWQRIFHKTS